MNYLTRMSMHMIRQYGYLILSLCIYSCGIYTFSGSTLPGHLKTVDVPLFVNRSLKPGVAEALTETVSKEVQNSNILKIVPENGDATIMGKVVSYDNSPYSYGSEAGHEVNVNSYSVTITVEIEFRDNKKDKMLFDKPLTIREVGIYDFYTQTEADGQKEALKKIINTIMQNTVQQW